MKIASRLGKLILADDTAFVIDLERSKGSWIVNAETGRKHLDCFSQFASQPLGWNHPKVNGQRDRLAKAATHKVANSDMYCAEYAEFVEAFANITPDFEKYFFISGGALGVENALKCAFDWKANKIIQNRKQTPSFHHHLEQTLDVIHFNEAFHGRTGYTLSLTNNPKIVDNPKTRWFPKFKWTRVLNPKLWHPIQKGKVERLERIVLDEMTAALTRGKVAAIILEPIQGEGGDNHFRKEFFEKVKQLADTYEAMLIFDEVQTGMGLTGKMWAYEHFGVIPDLMCFGKKVQTCGFCARTDKLNEFENNVFTEPSRINSTWGGNIVDMVRSTIYMDIIEEENLVENAKNMGKYFLDGIKSMGVLNPRGRGLMIAFDLSSEKERDAVLNRMDGVLALPCGTESIRFRPHLDITQTDIDFALSAIKKAI